MVAGRLENAPFSDSRQRRAGLLGRVALRRYDGGDFALSDRLDGCRTDRKSYLVLAVCAALFLSFAYSSHMETVRAQIICSSHRYVWDADLQKCREGCFVWMAEDECLSDEKPQKRPSVRGVSKENG